MPEKENQAVNDFSHLSQYQMPKERRGGKRNRRRVRKREKETTLVGEREGKRREESSSQSFLIRRPISCVHESSVEGI